MNRAACRTAGLENDLFFPISYGPGSAGQIAEARAVCRSCPVAKKCLKAALEQAEPEGIWAGLTPDERREIRTGMAVAS